MMESYSVYLGLCLSLSTQFVVCVSDTSSDYDLEHKVKVIHHHAQWSVATVSDGKVFNTQTHTLKWPAQRRARTVHVPVVCSGGCRCA